ncbi:MAG: hypothetical protein QXW97_02765 [Candidatus Pacearchaeota archaeon]
MPALRKRYIRGHFWSEGTFCVSCINNYERVMKYVEKRGIL